MSYEFYKVVHLLGLSLVVLSLGGVFHHVINGGTKASDNYRKATMITHGVGLLLLVVAGFGMLAKMGIYSPPPWAMAKIVIWLALGAFAGIAYKRADLARKFWFAVPVLVSISAVLAIYK